MKPSAGKAPSKHSPAMILAALLTANYGEAEIQNIMTPGGGSRLTPFSKPEDEENWPLYVSSTPEEPDECGTIYDTTPISHGLIQATGEQSQHFGLQLRVRSKEYASGWQKISAALRALIMSNAFVDLSDQNPQGFYRICACVPSGGIVALGVEREGQKRRQLFTVNFLATIVEEA